MRGAIDCSAPPSSADRMKCRRRRIRGSSVVILLAVTCLSLSDMVLSSASSALLARSSARIISPADLAPPCSSTESSAFIFSLLKSRRRKNSEAVGQKEPAAPLVVEKMNGDHGNGLIMEAPKVNGDHKYYLGDTRNNGRRKNGHTISSAVEEVAAAILDIDIVEDEPYATMHPIHNAHNDLSLSTEPSTIQDVSENGSLDSMEGSDDTATYIVQDVSDNVSLDSMEGSDDQTTSVWAKKNARSVDEGIRFKSQLREGLEEQTKQHRERLLSNMLEGVIGSSSSPLAKKATSALESLENVNVLESLENVNVTGVTKNVTNRFRWLRFGRGGDKGAAPEGEDISSKAKKGRRKRDVYEEIHVATAFDGSKYETVTTKDTSNNSKFGARTIAGLIQALAEEVEGLEVEVDADANTPIWKKTVHSIKISFSRLGFRQLRMGGLDQVFTEIETSMTPSERFALASNFLKGGQPTTPDEAFDKIDVDKSGALDEEELAQALKMAVVAGGNKFSTRSKEVLTELASRLVRLYDTDGDGVVDREEYQAMVKDMAAVRDARLREATDDQTELERLQLGNNGEVRKRGWLSSLFGGKENKPLSSTTNSTTVVEGDNIIMDVTENEDLWGAIDQGEGSIVFEDLKLDLRRLFFGLIPRVKRILPGEALVLKPFTATITASFNKDDLMESRLLDNGLRRLVARALSRRVRSLRDLMDGAVFYGRTWKLFEQNSPLVEVSKFEDVHFDHRDRLVITGRAKITEALGVKHGPVEQGFKLRTKIGTRADGRIIGLLQPEIAIFAECPKELENSIRATCKEWFDYTIPKSKFEPLYAYIPLVSPLKKNDKMDGFNMGEDNQIKSIEIKNGKLMIQFCAFLRPGRFLGNHYLAFTVPNRTLILTLDRVREGMRNARRNKQLAKRAAREVQLLAAAKDTTDDGDCLLVPQSNNSHNEKPSISPEGKDRIRRLEEEMKAKIQEDMILQEMEESCNSSPSGQKSFISRFVEGYSGAIRQELDLEMNARLSSSISDFFGRQDGEEEERKER